MSRDRRRRQGPGRRLAMLGVVLAGLAGLAGGAAQADDSLLPSGFFDNTPQIGTAGIAVTADQLTYDADTHQVIAVGKVEVDYDGYHIVGNHLVFDQRAHTARFVGDVSVHAPDGTIYRAPDMRLTAAMHDALMRQLTITTPDGALVTAADGDFQSGVQTVLNDATYAPCGRCIDAKGHRIGWSVHAARMVYDGKTSIVTLSQPSLYLLGIPVAWLPWLSLPDPTKRISGFRMPYYNYGTGMGSRLSVPYFIAAGRDTDIILTPALMTRQGFMMSGEVDQRFAKGAIQVKTSGVYQLDPSAYAGQVGDRRWRGAFQVSGQFTPVQEWTVGWSYTAFSDANYFSDYQINTDKSSVNEVYATKLSRNEFFDFRLQQFNVLGNVTQAVQDQQALALPNMRYRKVLYLPHDMGELDLSADLLGVSRKSDDVRATLTTPGGSPVPYTMGYSGWKAHGTVEADWQKQWIAGGFAITPYVGVRADAAYYDGTSTLRPGAIDLFNATPIAAVDVRFPLVGRLGPATQVLEPIAQLVYRASDVTAVGITNDNAQSFVFEDTNLFSYNRFSGTDRQETGLRANIGAHYQVNLDNGGWFDLLGGESFQLAGANAFAAPDPAQATTGEGLDSAASYAVLGATASVIPGLTTGLKLQVDPAAPKITRAGLGSTYSRDGYDFSLDYLYIAQNPARGVPLDQHEIAAGVSAPVPFIDYWKVDAHGAWDLARNSWLDVGGGIHYDDNYLRYGADIDATGPTNTTPNNLTVSATLSLKGLGTPAPSPSLH